MLLPGRNKMPGQRRQGGGPDSAAGLVFATCTLDQRTWGTLGATIFCISKSLLRKLKLLVSEAPKISTSLTLARARHCKYWPSPWNPRPLGCSPSASPAPASHDYSPGWRFVTILVSASATPPHHPFHLPLILELPPH